MAGIIHKIEEKLGMGGKKEEVKHSGEHKGQSHAYGGEHKPEKKEGIVDKIKGKIGGGESGEACKDGKKDKKNKKDKKKKHGDGHKSGDSSSSSDSD